MILPRPAGCGFDTPGTLFYDAAERCFVVGPLGIPEMIFIFILALLIFGPRKLPELGRTLGNAMTEFRRASNDLRHAFDDEVREMERQAQAVKREVTEAVIAPQEPPPPVPEAAASVPHDAQPATESGSEIPAPHPEASGRG